MELYWIWLSTVKYVGPILQKSLLEAFGCPSKIFKASERELAEVPSMNKRAQISIMNSKSIDHSKKILRDCEQRNIQILSFNDECYPTYAKNCQESPVLLYYKGTLKPITDAVAVVGSRRCSPYGKRVAREIGSELAVAGIPLISGFAKGIDSYAQSACVENGGYTIAFLANGVDVCYPKEQLSLYEKLLRSGSLFISSYPPGTKPRPEYFLQRNALISAWSSEVVVVEATAKSGALSTAKYAQNHGRHLFAVPNQIGVAEGEGTNKLIADDRARVFLGMESLKKRPNQPEKPTTTQGENSSQHLSETQQQILSLLCETPKPLSAISRNVQLPEESVLEELFALELQGEVIMRGNMITKVRR